MACRIVEFAALSIFWWGIQGPLLNQRDWLPFLSCASQYILFLYMEPTRGTTQSCTIWGLSRMYLTGWLKSSCWVGPQAQLPWELECADTQPALPLPPPLSDPVLRVRWMVRPGQGKPQKLHPGLCPDLVLMPTGAVAQASFSLSSGYCCLVQMSLVNPFQNCPQTHPSCTLAGAAA